MMPLATSAETVTMLRSRRGSTSFFDHTSPKECRHYSGQSLGQSRQERHVPPSERPSLPYVCCLPFLTPPLKINLLTEIRSMLILLQYIYCIAIWLSQYASAMMNEKLSWNCKRTAAHEMHSDSFTYSDQFLLTPQREAAASRIAATSFMPCSSA